MKRDPKSKTKRGISEAELWRAVEENSKRDPEYARRVAQALKIARPVLAELANAGYDELRTIGQLRRLGRDWKSALPILMRWLPVIEDPEIKEEIVRCLSVPWVGNRLTGELIKEFEQADPRSSLAWAIGNALSIVSVKGFEEQIVGLASDSRYGMARQMIVLSLGRMRTREAENLAVELLDDEDVKIQALSALRKMGTERSLHRLEGLLTDKRALIRKAVRKTITKIASRASSQ